VHTFAALRQVGFVAIFWHFSLACRPGAAWCAQNQGERMQKRLDRPGDPYCNMGDYPTPGLILQNPQEKGTFLILQRLACIIRFSFSGYINSGNYIGFLKRRVKNEH
jgi:hypothetical protein